MKIQSALLVFILFCFFSNCNNPAKESGQKDTNLGVIAFEAEGKQEAQPFFQKGLLLLHSFQYADAAEEFRNAQYHDPGFAMAYWGEAMTYNHPLWSAQNYEKGVNALSKFGKSKEERLNKIKSELERDLFNAVEILYGEGDKVSRDQDYAAFMESLYEKYPGNHEVAAFYALSLLGSVPVGRDVEIYEKGAGIAKGILSENPDHPGALHYLIHSYDDPDHARFALEAAFNYSKVAPDAAHALHMPSHIYVAMGMWDDVILANVASYQASVSRMVKKGLSNDARNYHAYHWLLYGYLQKGMIEKASEIMDNMIGYTNELSSPRGRAYLTLMKGAYLAETSDWVGKYSNLEIDVSDLNISIKAIAPFMSGMKAHANQDPEGIDDAIAQIREYRELAEGQLAMRGITVCSGVGFATQAPNQQDIDHAKVLEYELQALQATLTGQINDAESYLKKATDLEDQLSYIFGPPMIIKPSHELFGEWLYNQGRYSDAIQQFDQAFEKAPKRSLSLKGKLKAAEQTGDQELIRSLKRELDQNYAPLKETEEKQV